MQQQERYRAMRAAAQADAGKVEECGGMDALEDCLWNFKRGIPAPLLAESSDSEEGEERAGPSAGAPQGAARGKALGLLALRRRGGAARSLTRGLAERGCAVLIVMSASAIMSEKRESAAKHRFGLLEAGGQPGSRGAQPRRCRVPTSFGGAPRRAQQEASQEAGRLLCSPAAS
ncbi:unnamed protein product [Prorocentrum cordatum]|uniref:Uncharacterized protein n=1 Tax=Prorocentrum cordatum TaxID=2364126 RepID=A0ABN9XT20_9DINO|nr:unnamed protein product [Polarella glacialis]